MVSQDALLEILSPEKYGFCFTKNTKLMAQISPLEQYFLIHPKLLIALIHTCLFFKIQELGIDGSLLNL